MEAGKIPELAPNYNQSKVKMLYTYIGLSLNLAISVIEYYQVFFIYVKAHS